MSTFHLDTKGLQQAVDAIPKADRQRFPAHIFEPERIEIARELFLKEQYKLYRSLQPTDFEQMGSDVLQWLPGQGYELAPVSDFWNYIDGTLATLKLKNVIPAVTSVNINWTLEQLNPKNLVLEAPIGTLKDLGRPPYTYDFINQNILKDDTQLELNKQISDKKSQDTAVKRDHYPILVRRNKDGSLKLLDGNRRTLRALLYDKPAIEAWVGTVQNTPELKDHWVNTGMLYRLLSQYEQSQTETTKESIRSQLCIVLQSSRIARINFAERCVPHYPFAAGLASEIDLLS